MNYISEMNKILKEKKKQGLVGIKFCILPKSKKAATDHEAMARAFCKLDDLRKRGVLKATTSQFL